MTGLNGHLPNSRVEIISIHVDINGVCGSFWGCYSELPSCLIACCIPCGNSIVQGLPVSRVTGENCCFTLLLAVFGCCIGMAVNRKTIRQRFEYYETAVCTFSVLSAWRLKITEKPWNISLLAAGIIWSVKNSFITGYNLHGIRNNHLKYSYLEWQKALLSSILASFPNCCSLECLCDKLLTLLDIAESAKLILGIIFLIGKSIFSRGSWI